MPNEKPSRCSPRPVAERKKRSCGECRRRKQKCDQRQPCRNCSRRVPQPVCHYEGSPIRERIISDHLPGPTTKRAPDKQIQTFNTDIVLPASPQGVLGANHTGYCALTGFLTGPYEYDDTFGGAYHVWDVAERGESSHPPGYCGHISASPIVLDQILALRQPMQNAVTLYTPSCLPLWLRSGTNSSLPLFIETCRLSEETATDKDTLLTTRCAAIRELHAMLALPELSTSDGAIEAVVKLVMADLCYGEIQDLGVHIRGASEMVKLRGGLATLGTNRTLAKMVIFADLAAAITMETASLHLDQNIFEYNKSIENGSASSAAASPAAPLSLDPGTAAMTKDVEFLLDTILALPTAPSAWQLQKVQTMSQWVQGRLASATNTASTPCSQNLQRAVRLSSVLYCRAIQAREPFSHITGEKDIAPVLDAVWSVPLETWNDMLGTLISVLVIILPTAKDMPECYTTRTMMMAAAVQLALTDWNAAARVLSRVVRLQAWLRTPTQG